MSEGKMSAALAQIGATARERGAYAQKMAKAFSEAAEVDVANMWLVQANEMVFYADAALILSRAVSPQDRLPENTDV